MADTQSMPALAKALAGVLPDGAVRQLMQALGNCNQPYTSRGVQNFQAPEQLGNNNGVYSGGPWNPSQYPGLIPDAGSQGRTVIPGPGGWTGGNYYGGATNSTNYGGNSFYFPTSQEFALNNYYGGPIFNVGGNSTFENITTNNITTNNITINSGGGVGGFGGDEPEPGGPGGDGGGMGGGLGLPGGGGGVGVVVIGGRRVGRVTGRQINLRASARVRIPNKGTLKDDCSVELSDYRPTNVNVEFSPSSFMALG